MSRYIDADVFLKALDKLQKPHDIGFGETSTLVSINLKALINLVKDLPTADVVEVVRCKECIYMGADKCPSQLNDADFYCCQGERREDE